MPIFSSGTQTKTRIEVHHGQLWESTGGRMYKVIGLKDDSVRLGVLEPELDPVTRLRDKGPRTITTSTSRLGREYVAIACRRCGKSHGEMTKEYNCEGCGARLCDDQVEATYSSRLYHRVWTKDAISNPDDFNIRHYKECGKVVPLKP